MAAACCRAGGGILLPSTMICYDEPARVLRVDLDETLASRYPEFDRDEFQAMTQRDRPRIRNAAARVLPADA